MSLALVESIQRAVKDDRVTSLASAVARLHECGSLEDPDLYLSTNPERYARRLIWQDPDKRFVVVAMTWAPGQETPLHDHDGLWGVEIVVAGTMRETSYRLVDCAGDGSYAFRPERERVSSKGTASVICPPYDYHTFGNVGTTPARTLHVYGGSMERSNAFTPQADGRWRSQRVELKYDA